MNSVGIWMPWLNAACVAISLATAAWTWRRRLPWWLVAVNLMAAGCNAVAVAVAVTVGG